MKNKYVSSTMREIAVSARLLRKNTEDTTHGSRQRLKVLTIGKHISFAAGIKTNRT